MIRPYRDVLSEPGALAFVIAGLFARMPISMLGIGIVLLISLTTGSYALAGAVAAVFGIVAALAAPQIARFVDRFGQARVLRPAVVIHVLGLLFLVLAVLAGLPSWTFFVGAVISGLAMGSVGALVRARWSHLLGEDRRLHTAFSLESVLDEVVFIMGPLLVTVLATQLAPAAGLLAAGVFALVGGLVLAGLRRTEPPVNEAAQAGGGRSLLRVPGMVVLISTFVFVGAIFGSAEVVAVAFTDERGVPGAAGAVLACFALGSMLAGLGYGAIHWHSPPGRRFLYGVVLLAVGVIPFAFATNVAMLAAVMFVAGFAISPMIIAGNGVVQIIAPAHRLTEGLTWVATSIGLGTAAAAAVSGIVIDSYGAHRAFLVTVAAGALAAITVAAGSRWLHPAALEAGTASDLSPARAD